MSTNDPIGVIDSGSGGLSIIERIIGLLPKESIISIGDHANAPYGNKSEQFITKRIEVLIEWLLARNVKLIVIACNTATIAGISQYRAKYTAVPIIGVVPVVKTAASVTKTKHIVVLSTEFTAKSDYQKNLIAIYALGCRVDAIGTSALVPLIEQGIVKGETVSAVLKQTFASVRDTDFDVVVLGCTHYPFIKQEIARNVGGRVTILDSSDAVARHVQRILTTRESLSSATASHSWYTTGNIEQVSAVYSKLLHKRLEVQHAAI